MLIGKLVNEWGETWLRFVRHSQYSLGLVFTVSPREEIHIIHYFTVIFTGMGIIGDVHKYVYSLFCKQKSLKTEIKALHIFGIYMHLVFEDCKFLFRNDFTLYCKRLEVTTSRFYRKTCLSYRERSWSKNSMISSRWRMARHSMLFWSLGCLFLSKLCCKMFWMISGISNTQIWQVFDSGAYWMRNPILFSFLA